jgi:hypothetical protein
MSDEAPVIERVYCFLDRERVCGPECMAFLTHPRQSNSSELSDLQAHCTLLTGMDRLGRNITIIASTLTGKARSEAIKEQDTIRERNTPKADPLGPLGSPFPIGRKP